MLREMTKTFYAKIICTNQSSKYNEIIMACSQYYEQKYCYTKISRTKILQIILMRISVVQNQS